MYGRVTRYFQDRGFGFILGKDGNTYFIHRSNLYGEHIEAGYYVYFKTFQTDRSDYNAKYVTVIEDNEKELKKKKPKRKKRAVRTIINAN